MVAKFIRGYNHANYVEETICYSFAITLFLQHPIFYIYFLVRVQLVQTSNLISYYAAILGHCPLIQLMILRTLARAEMCEMDS